jgi:hypothetical protein
MIIKQTSLDLNGPILSFVQQPQPVTISCENVLLGSAAIFVGIATATFPQQSPENPATSTGTITYRWYDDNGPLFDDPPASGGDGVTITGAATTTLTLYNNTRSKKIFLRADYIPSAYSQPTGSAVEAGTAKSTGNATNEPIDSNIVDLDLKPTIILTSQPLDQTAVVNTNAVFSTSAVSTDGSSLSYQWQINNSNLSDATEQTTSTTPASSTLTITDDFGQTTKVDFASLSTYSNFITGRTYTLVANNNIQTTITALGAGGGSSIERSVTGGVGGFSSGRFTFLKDQQYRLVVGGRGVNGGAGGFGGGGNGGGGTGKGGGGGGYTGLFLSTVSQSNAIIIAGGGGGGNDDPARGGSGGGNQGSASPTLFVGESVYTTPGTYTWICPEDVYSVCAVCVGGGGGAGNGLGISGGGGGGLGYKNNISVIPGQSYTVVVGSGGVGGAFSSALANGGTSGGDSYFINSSTVRGGGGAGGGTAGSGGRYVGDGGGNGGNSAGGGGPGTSGPPRGGGGAGGYGPVGGAAGNGGNGGDAGTPLQSGGSVIISGGAAGTNGAGGGGSGGRPDDEAGTNGIAAGGGGGVGLYGRGSSGQSVSGNGVGGNGGSGGGNGLSSYGLGSSSVAGNGGFHGGGGGQGVFYAKDGTGYLLKGGNGASGAVRIIWGDNRSFPSNAGLSQSISQTNSPRNGLPGTQSSGGAGGSLDGTAGSAGSALKGGDGGAGGGAGYYGGGGGQSYTGCCAGGSGAGGSGFLHPTLLTNTSTSLGGGSSGDGSFKIDLISAIKTAVVTASGTRTPNLTIRTDTVGLNQVRCIITHPTACNSPVITRSANFTGVLAGEILNYESVSDNGTFLGSGSLNLSNNPITFNADPSTQYPSVVIYPPEKDIRVRITLAGAAGATVSRRGIGGEGGLSVFEYTLKQNTEYTLKLGSVTGSIIGGANGGGGAAYLYEKARLIAVCGGGGGGRVSAIGAGGGGAGGGIGVGGENGKGTDGGVGGRVVTTGSLPTGSGTLPSGLRGGQVSGCTIGKYYAQAGFSPCQDVGNTQWRDADGNVTSQTATIQRGYKAGQGLRNTGGSVRGASYGGGGGSGAYGGNAADRDTSGGGGGSGYTDGSVTVISTQLGGNSSTNAFVTIGLAQTYNDFFIDSFGRILILSSSTVGKDPRTLTKTTGKVLVNTDTCIDDARWQNFIELARTQNYRLTATLNNSTTKIINATDNNIRRMINGNNITLKNSLTAWEDTGYYYQLLALAWDETNVSGGRGFGSDYSILSWSPSNQYGFGYYGESSNPFFVGTTYSRFTANWWILPPGVPDF